MLVWSDVRGGPIPARAGMTRRAAIDRSIGIFGVAMVVLHPAIALAKEEGPEQFIQNVGNKTFGILADATFDKARKFDQLQNLLNNSVDLPIVARLSLGRYLRELDPAQLKKYQEIFQKIIVKTMADGMNNYNGQTFAIVGSRRADDRDTVVSTLINHPSGSPPNHVDWRVRQEDVGYSIVDIVVEGVSLVVTQRNEINGMISRVGVNGLIAEMERRQANAPQTGLPSVN